MNYLLIDAGNSFCKTAIYHSEIEQMGEIISLSYDETETYLIKTIQEKGIDAIWLSNVNNKLFDEQVREIAELLEIEHFFQFNTKEHQNDLTSRYKNKNKLGCDRWAAMLAIKCNYHQDSYCVIDCGTAITIDLVIERKHQGGMIAPGIVTSLKSLNVNTANLPNIGLIETEDQVRQIINATGQSTEDCIISGVYLQAVGLIEKAIKTYRDSYKQNFPVFISGGDGKILTSLSELDFQLSQNLVLEGLVAVIKSNKKYP